MLLSRYRAGDACGRFTAIQHDQHILTAAFLAQHFPTSVTHYHHRHTLQFIDHARFFQATDDEPPETLARGRDQRRVPRPLLHRLA
jgi:hypothetical protein